MKNYILALDQGTTSSRAILFNRSMEIVSISQKEFTQYYPQKGWVEHDPYEILATQIEVAKEAIQKANVDINDIDSIGITNQRETTIVWDRATGKPLYNAIVWQCRRTSDYCSFLKQEGFDRTFREKTGLVIDAYFSATKIKWILENVSSARESARSGNLMFGTVDSWLLYNLTGGKVHATDFSNASRTMLFNIHTLQWDKEILELLEIPESLLPQVNPSSSIYGYTKKEIFGKELPLGGIAGDQQAALFGQTCFEKGMAKNTYGTGSFLLMNTGETPFSSNHGLLTTIAWGLKDRISYALEGSIFVTGAAIQWLRDGLKIIRNSEETEECATRVQDTNGVYFVPAFVGLGAPYWDMYARGTIVGITRDTTRDHIIRAALESIAYETREVIESMEKDSGISLTSLKVDGGAVKNNFLMQFQADILGVPVVRPSVTELTALGAATLSGLATGFYSDLRQIAASYRVDRVYEPQMNPETRNKLFSEWKRAVERSLNWSR